MKENNFAKASRKFVELYSKVKEISKSFVEDFTIEELPNDQIRNKGIDQGPNCGNSQSCGCKPQK